MCLAIPGKILEMQEMGAMRAARVQFGGVVRQVSLSLTFLECRKLRLYLWPIGIDTGLNRQLRLF